MAARRRAAMSCTTGSGSGLAEWWRRCPWKGIVRPPMHKAFGLTAGRVRMFRNAARAVVAAEAPTMYLTDGEGHARRVSGGGWAVPTEGSAAPASPPGRPLRSLLVDPDVLARRHL